MQEPGERRVRRLGKKTKKTTKDTTFLAASRNETRFKGGQWWLKNHVY